MAAHNKSRPSCTASSKVSIPVAAGTVVVLASIASSIAGAVEDEAGAVEDLFLHLHSQD